MIRKYGTSPYKIAFIHGGPGAPGSMALPSKMLSCDFGVLEPVQSKLSIKALIEELNAQIKENVSEPIVFAGHSWGAWLSVLYTKQYPALVRSLVLIGSGPFENKYARKITERRLNRLNDKEQGEYLNILYLLEHQEKDTDRNQLMNRLGELAYKTDNYELDIFDPCELASFEPNPNMYASVWQEASGLRQTGDLVKALDSVKCPVHVIHGEDDPHPYDGVIIPLEEHGVKFEKHILPKCGHSPFKEKYAAKEFYGIIKKIVNG